ncbi:MAG: PKD domain-containing protein [Bacteroidota bacterium]
MKLTIKKYRFPLIFVISYLAAFTQIFGQAGIVVNRVPDGCGFLRANFSYNTGDPAVTVDPNNVTWDFDNGNSSNSINPQALFSEPRTYTVEVSGNLSNGNPFVDQVNVVVSESPTAVINLSGIANGACELAPTTVQFNASNSISPSGSPLTYQWSFGDGTISNDEIVEHTYSTPGNYQVTLTVSDAAGCANTAVISQDIVVREGFNLTLDATGTRQICSLPNTIQFEATHDAGNYSYLWNFGDGTTSDIPNPTYQYMASGVYDVSLTVTNLDDGCGSTIVEPAFVQIADFIPEIQVTGNPTGCAPLATTFENISNIISPSQQITWDFGDGTIISGTADSLVTPSHTYTTPGIYNVSVTIVDSETGCSGDFTLNNAVEVPAAPVADFTADRTGFCATNSTVSFSNTSTGAESFLWNFGDGNTSPEENPTHIYTNFGSYTVTLTVTNAQGCTGQIERPNYINIAETTAGFGAYEIGGCAPNFMTTLVDSTTTAVEITNYEWEIVNARTGQVVDTYTEIDPLISLGDTGVYNVTLRVRTAEGCEDEILREDFLSVGASPISMDFTPPASLVCNGTTVEFTNNSVVDPNNPYETTWGWNFLGGDSIMSTDFNGSYTYDNSDPNPFTVTLYAFSNGCIDTFSIENAVTVQLPKADFEYYTVPCVADSLYLVDASMGADQFEWNITINGNATTINDQKNPVLYVPPGGSWEATLRVRNNASQCEDIITQSGMQPTLGAPDFTGISLNTISTGICFPAEFQIDASSVTIQGSNITNYYWDFGNGQTQSGADANPTIVYNEPGFYSVNLIITSDQGCKYDTLLVDFVKVYGPEINFEVCDAGTCKDREVTFTDLSSSIAPIVTWEWDFDGDGIIDSNDEFPQPWVYGVVNDPQYEFFWAKLTVTDSLGCTASDSVKVRPTEPLPDHDIMQQPACGGDMVGFINVDSLSEGLQPFSAQWEFSDGQTAGGLEPVLFFEGNTTGIEYTGVLSLFDLNGCIGTDSIRFTVITDSLVADFTPPPVTSAQCPPYTVEFVDASQVFFPVQVDSFGTNMPVNWYWDFGDGNQLSGSPNPIYTYTEPGTYDVTLIAEDALGCFDTLVVANFITIDGPQGDFTVSDTIGYPDLAVNFEAFPDNPDNVITWDFGNGEFGEGINPFEYTYTEPGAYLAGLILLDSLSGCQDLVGTQRIEVLPCPFVADTIFDYCVSEGELLLDSFDSTHILRLGTMNYVWQDITDQANPIALGDSASITIDPPLSVNQTQVSETRVYQLEVFVSDLTHNNPNNSDTKCQQIVTYEVTFLPSPEASFEYELNCAELQNLSPTSPVNVQIIDTSIDNGLGISSWSWDIDNDSIFGDEVTQDIVFTADSAGVYPIALVVQANGNVCTDTIRSAIYVPAVNFGFNNACSGQEILFSDSTIFDPAFGVPDYLWDFGDGTTSPDQNPTHSYRDPGIKVVTLTATVSLSLIETCDLVITREVDVRPTPDASFTVLSACLGTPTIFEASANPNIISYAWDFENDGTIDTVTTTNTLERVFTSNGTQTVGLTVTSLDSCINSSDRTFDIVPNPIADFAPNACDIDGVTFTDLSNIDTSSVATFISQREIDLGDGNGFRPIADLNSFTTRFNAPGQYPITYRVISNFQCIDDTTKILTIPIADFMAEDVCFGEEAQFLDQSTTFGSAVILYEWDFDSDGIIDAQGTSASFAYPAPGTYDVTLTITNLSGCTATITKPILVKPAPIVQAMEDVFICAGDSIELSATANSVAPIVSFEWDNGGGSGESVIVSPEQTTLYTVIVTDTTGCTGEDFVLVNVIDLPYLPTDTLICEGNSYVVDATIPGGIPAVYSWSTGSIEPIIEITESGTYTVEAIAAGFDVPGRECVFTRTINVEFNTSPLPIGGQITTCFFEDGAFVLSLPENFTNVVWSSEILPFPVLENEIQVSEIGAFFVTATNEFGCELSDSVSIQELCEPLVFLPNAFTPNGDGLNDGFEVKGANFLNFELTIYNRWGEMIFQSTDRDQPWMGNFNGRPMPAGLYPYVVKFESELDPGEQMVRYGNVSLIR